MSERTEALAQKVDAQLHSQVRRLPSLAHELAYECDPAALIEVCRTLRDAPELKFEMLMDLARYTLGLLARTGRARRAPGSQRGAPFRRGLQPAVGESQPAAAPRGALR